MNKKSVLTFLLCPFMVGCASLQDFQKMTALERAIYTCERHSKATQLQSERTTTHNAIDEVTLALTRGYRELENCVEVTKKEPREKITKCVKNSKGKETCKTKIKKAEVNDFRVCSTTQVPVDAYLEQANLDRLQEQASFLDSEYYEFYESCLSLVENMSAEEAFRYYQDT